MFRKYIGDVSRAGDEYKDEIEKINHRIDAWSNLLGRTNQDIEAVKEMVTKLQDMVLRNDTTGSLMAESAAGQEELSGALVEVDEKNREIDVLRKSLAQMKAEKGLQSRHIDELEAQLSKKNQEIITLNAAITGTKEELLQQGELATKINNKKMNAMSILISELKAENESKNQQLTAAVIQMTDKTVETEEMKAEINRLKTADEETRKHWQVKISEAYGMIDTKEKLINRLNGQIHELTDANTAHTKRLEEFALKVNDKAKDIDSLNDKIAAFEKEKIEQRRQTTGFEQKLREKEQAIDVLTAALANAEEESSRQRQKVNQLNSAASSVQQQNDKLEYWNATYHPLMEKIYHCMALKAFVENNKLGNAITLENMLHFIKCVGDGYRFVHRVHRAFAIYKQEIQEPITAQEIEVYQAINRYYRQAKKIDFDIFMLPNGLSVEDHFCEGMDFEASEVRDIMTEDGAEFKTIRCVYVPVLRDKHKEIVLKGVVKGDRNELF